MNKKNIFFIFYLTEISPNNLILLFVMYSHVNLNGGMNKEVNNSPTLDLGKGAELATHLQKSGEIIPNWKHF